MVLGLLSQGTFETIVVQSSWCYFIQQCWDGMFTGVHLTSPHLTSPHLTSPHLTSPHLTSPHLTSPHLTSPHLTSPHLTSPLVTWHRSKNPQDGSRGTDCPHALPRSKPVVIRRDPSCVFPVSGRAHPARQPSRTPPWARHAVLWGTDAPTWPPPTARRQRSAGSVAGYHRGAANEYVRHCDATARVERHRGAAPTALRRHGAGSVAGHHRGATNVPVRRCGAAFWAERRRGAAFSAERRRGAAQTIRRQRGATSGATHRRGAVNVHVRRRGAIFGARRRRHIAQTALCLRGASSVTWHHRGAVNVHGAVVAQPSGQSATVALPRQFSCTSLAMVYPPGQYSRHHGGVCTWRSANLRDTPCRGDVSSAVLTASRAIGARHRLARAPSWCHFLGRVPSRCTYRGARRLGSAFAAGRRR